MGSDGIAPIARSKKKLMPMALDCFQSQSQLKGPLSAENMNSILSGWLTVKNVGVRLLHE